MGSRNLEQAPAFGSVSLRQAQTLWLWGHNGCGVRLAMLQIQDEFDSLIAVKKLNRQS